jgi:cell division protein FtsI/penicillin-binding protein 2
MYRLRSAPLPAPVDLHRHPTPNRTARERAGRPSRLRPRIGLGRLKRAAALSAVLLATCGAWAFLPERALLLPPDPPSGASAPAAKPQPAQIATPRTLDRQALQELVAGRNLLNLAETALETRSGTASFTVHTTLEPGLQQHLSERLDRKNSRAIGIVALDPADGRVLAMVGYDRTDPAANPCLDSRFPAASVFKIVTAAAALEARDLEPHSVMRWDGGKYTLYKSQLRPTVSRRPNQLTFKESFAQSVNPVFGRLGAHLLGRDLLANYAEAFGFNQEIEFDLPVRPSRLDIADNAFGLAEVASGFNRTTRISPLHGALMAAAVVNAGRLVEPAVVDRVTDAAGRTVYQRRSATGERVIDARTAAELREMMRATVQSGTAYKEFHRHHADRVLAQLEIGGKTGSMGDDDPDMRYDWFVGFARSRQMDRQMVFAVVVVHEDYIGTRAAGYAAMAIREHFKPALARVDGRAPKS